MIDTIVLALPASHFYITDHARFSPSTLGFYQAPYYTGGFMKCVQNPISKELRLGLYKPRLTVLKRPMPGGFAITLKIEFSIPKLLYGNNFDEVTEADFERVTRRLRECLDTMGVVVVPALLRSASVSAIHYSKNIPLTDYSTPQPILTELAKANLSQRLDLNRTDFRNEGHAVKFHANSFEVVFYDKLKDLRKAKVSEKRAIEPDNLIQLELFERVTMLKPFEVIRMEVRINKRPKLISLLKRLKYPASFTFKSLYSAPLSQAVLRYYFAEIAAAYAIIPPKPDSWKNFPWSFRLQNPKSRARKMLQVAGATCLLNELGERGFREAMRGYGASCWPRLKKELIELTPSGRRLPSVQVIQKALDEFIPLRLPNRRTENHVDSARKML